jgi:hypothetical protein
MDLGCVHPRVRMVPTSALAASETRYGCLQHMPWLHPTHGMGKAKMHLGLFEHPFRMHPCSVSGTLVPGDGCIRSYVWPDGCARTEARIPRFGSTQPWPWTCPSTWMDTRIPGYGSACTVRRMPLYRGTDSLIIALEGTQGTGRAGSTHVSAWPMTGDGCTHGPVGGHLSHGRDAPKAAFGGPHPPGALGRNASLDCTIFARHRRVRAPLRACVPVSGLRPETTQALRSARTQRWRAILLL